MLAFVLLLELSSLLAWSLATVRAMALAVGEGRDMVVVESGEVMVAVEAVGRVVDMERVVGMVVVGAVVEASAMVQEANMAVDMVAVAVAVVVGVLGNSMV